MNYVYLITGADSDIGTAFMERVCGRGDIVVAQGFGSMDKLEALKDILKADMRVFQADLSDPAKTQEFIGKVRVLDLQFTHFIHLPALQLVYNKFTRFNEERFEMDFSVQMRSAVALCKEFLPSMAKNRFGRVLFMLSSSLIGVPPKNTAEYVVVKGALEALAKSLAIDYAAQGVTVNCVMPSMMETKFLENTPSLIIQAAAAENPMKRNAHVDDVVPAMAFLVSEEARFITGVTLPVTGGGAML